MCLFAGLFVCLSVCLSICLSVYLVVCVFCLSVCLSICLLICLCPFVYIKLYFIPVCNYPLTLCVVQNDKASLTLLTTLDKRIFQ